MKVRITIFLILTVFFALNSNAQMAKNTLAIGGLSSFSSDSNDDLNIINFSFSPKASCFITDKFSVGLIIPYTYRKLKSEEITNIQEEISIGAVIRYYFKYNKWLAFPQVSFTRGKEYNKNKNVLNDNKFTKWQNKIISYNIGGGIAYMIDDRVAIEGVLSYGKRKIEVSKFHTTSILNFSIGFQIFINRKKSES